jgi:4-hydroxythreonine-4-phosphate dehydrogenase
VLDCGGLDTASVQPGEVQAQCGRAAYTYIQAAVERALAGDIAGVATAPINKEAIRAAGIQQPGHTEILAHLTSSARVCMMLASDELIVSMVTTHIGFAQVPERLSAERVLDVIELTADAVTRLRNRSPRIGVCGLNPHSGEHGLFGNREEERFIEPAITAAREKGLNVEGPIPPDTAFVPNRRRQLDAIVCMYHDQGHIPFKMLAFDNGVNITLGLPIVRVSVDHGTAFDIAWKGMANRESMIQAVLYTARLGAQHAPGDR